MWSFQNAHYMSTESLLDSLHCSLSMSLTLGGPTLTGIQQDSADIRAVYFAHVVMYERGTQG